MKLILRLRKNKLIQEFSFIICFFLQDTYYMLSFILKFYATRNWLSTDLSSDIVQKREHVSVRTGRLKGENRDNSHQKNE